jgi:branched-subunit amino acid ABC-type transport system permease component
MAGGYVLVTALSKWNVPFPLALLMAFVLVALASVVLERRIQAQLRLGNRQRGRRVQPPPGDGG